MAYTAEADPLDELATLIDTEWVPYLEVPKPTIIVPNDIDNILSKHNLNDSDLLLIYRDGFENVRYRGNIRYYDKTIAVNIDVYTKISRQRLYDQYRDLRVIVFNNFHDLDSYQLIRMTSWTEYMNEQMNIWKGTLKMNLESAGVAIETS